MDRLRRAAILTRLIQELRTNGSWCGETHIQKATLFLQELMNVPVGFDFILYKHGPFSFDLRDELTGYRADDLVALEPQWPYGPRISATEHSNYIQKLFSKTILQYQNNISFVGQKLGDQGVAELERVATALFITRKRLPKGSVHERAEELSRLKPHVNLEAAMAAVEFVDELTDARAAMTA